MKKIALIGYGEVGRILGEDLRARGESVVAFDLKLSDARGHALREHALSHGIAIREVALVSKTGGKRDYAAAQERVAK